MNESNDQSAIELAEIFKQTTRIERRDIRDVTEHGPAVVSVNPGLSDSVWVVYP